MNPDGRWTAATPAAAQPYTTTPYQPQNPGDSLYLPQPDYTGHPAMRPTLPAPDRRRLRLLALLAAGFFILVVTIASLLVFHYATERPAHTGQLVQSSKSEAPSAAQKADRKRQQDLKLVQASLEAYVAKDEYYPTQAQMSSLDWLQANMPDLLPLTLAAADASDSSLAGRPVLPPYVYKASDATGAGCEAAPSGCSHYTLTTMLSDGSPYVLRSAKA